MRLQLCHIFGLVRTTVAMPPATPLSRYGYDEMCIVSANEWDGSSGGGAALGAGGGADRKKPASRASRLGLDTGRLFSVSSRNLFTAMRLFATQLQPQQQPGPRTTAGNKQGIMLPAFTIHCTENFPPVIIFTFFAESKLYFIFIYIYNIYNKFYIIYPMPKSR